MLFILIIIVNAYLKKCRIKKPIKIVTYRRIHKERSLCTNVYNNAHRKKSNSNKTIQKLDHWPYKDNSCSKQMTFLLFSYFVIKCWWISREQAWTLSWPIYLNVINDTPNIQNTIGGVHSSKWNLLLSFLIFYHLLTHLSKLIFLLGVCKTQCPWSFKTT